MSEHRHRQIERRCDVAVVGGSAAGLAAALQLGRQCRSVIVVDAGEPRNAPAAHVHGYLGHEGLPPSELAAIAREEVRGYGVEVLDGRVVGVSRDGDGAFRVELVGGHAIVARRVLAASGLVDELPDIEGVAEHWGRDVIHCPFCHGYEVRDRRIVQIATHPMSLHQATLFRHLSDRFTLVVDGIDGTAPELEALRSSGAQVLEQQVRRIVEGDDDGDDGRVTAVELVDGTTLDAEVVVVAARFRARAEPFAPLGLEPTAHPSGFGDAVEVDEMGATAVAGIYAAGNVTDPSAQVLHAAAHGSRVGAMIAADLAHEDLTADARPSANAADWDRRYEGEQMWSGNPNGTLVAEVEGLAAGRALDVGAGEGGDAIWMAANGWRVTANDISRRALDRVAAAAAERGLAVECLHADANALEPYEPGAYDLVSAQYASIPRTPDGRGIANLLDAVASGGTLLVVGHDLTPMRVPIDVDRQARAFDPDAYVRVDDVAAALTERPGWTIEVHEVRPRPGGHHSPQHVDDVVLRARRAS